MNASPYTTEEDGRPERTAKILAFIAAVSPFVGLALVGLLFSGCRAFYENAGLHVRTGSLTAPVEVSDGSDSINVRALYSMDGIDLYAAKQCVVSMKYRNVYTNSYIGLVETMGVQESDVTVEPCESQKPASD